MRILPLEHPEPLIATLGIMLYPGDDFESRRRARAFISQRLAEPLREFYAAGYTLTKEELAQIPSDGWVYLDDLKARWRDGLLIGEIVKTYVAIANTDPTRASWGNATKLVALCARRQGVAGSASYLYAIRSRFMPVAHLWGAFVLRDKQFRSDLDVQYEAWDDLQLFWFESELVLCSDRTWLPEKRGPERPMNVDRAWRVPSDWRPPEPKPGWPLAGGIPHLTIDQELLSHLKRPGRPRKSH